MKQAILLIQILHHHHFLQEDPAIGHHTETASNLKRQSIYLQSYRHLLVISIK